MLLGSRFILYAMSQPKQPDPVKLVIRFLFPISKVSDKLSMKSYRISDRWIFCPCPGLFPTQHTTITKWDRESKDNGRFLKPRSRGSLPDIKLRTNEIELGLSREGKRRVNIDPGLLSQERFVLATGKNFTHRIYLRDGIYADLTLIYQNGAYRPLPWTFPDCREAEFLHFLEVLRKKLRFQRNGILPKH